MWIKSYCSDHADVKHLIINVFLLSNMLNVITGRFTLQNYHFSITCYEKIHLKMSSTIKSCLLHAYLYVND